MNLSWTDSASSPTGSYQVMSKATSAKANSWSAGAPLGNVTTTSVAVSNNTSYDFAVRATTSVTRDSNVQTVSVSCAPGDGIAPSTPTITNIGSPTCSEADVWWSTSTDTGGSGLAGYNVYRNNTFVHRVNAPTTNYADLGLPASTTFSYAISAIDNAGNQSPKSPAITVTTIACGTPTPVANAGPDQTVLSLVSVSFNGSGSSEAGGTIASYAWNFGDGATGSGVAPSHTYAHAGSYTVTLTVTDGNGVSASDTMVVTVLNRAPTANAGPDQSGTAGTAVSFNGSGSSDLDGSITSYAWNFGDGATGSGVSTSHTYAAAGSYTATLTVTDNNGATGSDTATITIGSVPNKPPVANAGADQTALTLVNLTFNGSASSDPDGSIVSWAWNFGDGTTGSGSSVTHSFAHSGIYTVTLTVTDNQGATATDTAVATITNRPPVANAGADQTALSLVNVTFNGSASSDPDGTITSYAWNFGDGTTGNGASVAHSYAHAGSYTATLTVTDNNGATATDTAVATITNRPPTANAGADVSGSVGSSITFFGSGSDQDGTITSYTWNFGDGTTGSGASVSHTYSTAGTYTATLTVTDNNGATGSDTAAVTVTTPVNQPPTANAGPDIAGSPGAAVTFNGSGSDPDGSITAYNWNFGDGTTGNGASVSHTYSSAGTYTATLTVTDNNGATASDTAVATITSASGPPTVPTGLTATAASCTQVNLSWNPSSAGAGIQDYELFKDGIPLTWSTTTSYSWTGLMQMTKYSFQVAARDKAGTISASSTAVFVWTPSCTGAGWTQWAAQASNPILADSIIPESVAVDSSGNSVVVGNIQGTVQLGGVTLTGAGSTDIYIAKYSPTGQVLWAKSFGDSAQQNGTGVAVDSAGNIYMTGWYFGTVDFGTGPLAANQYDMVLAKYSPTGVPQWSKVLGGSSTDEAMGVAADSTGNVYLTGLFAATVDFGGGPITSAGGFDVVLAKYNTNGVYQWAKGMGGAGPDNVKSIALDPSGNPVIAGYFSGTSNFGGTNLVSAGANDVFVVRYSSAGVLQLSTRFGGTGDDRDYGVAVDASGNIGLVGYYFAPFSFGGPNLPTPAANSALMFFTKLNASGGYLWQKGLGSFTGGNGSVPDDVTFDGSGNMVVVGSMSEQFDLGGGVMTAPTITYDAFVAKYAPDGTYLWARRFPADWDDHANAVATDSSGNVTVVGDTAQGMDFGSGMINNPGGAAGWIAKLNP